jgi:hypothetical protein
MKWRVTPNPTVPRSPFWWVDGTVTDVGEQLSKGEETTIFRSLDICRRGGAVQRLTIVHAARQTATLITQHCIGTFCFWEQPDECRLWCVALADGPQGVDVEAMRQIIPAFEAGKVADAR